MRIAALLLSLCLVPAIAAEENPAIVVRVGDTGLNDRHEDPALERREGAWGGHLGLAAQWRLDRDWSLRLRSDAHLLAGPGPSVTFADLGLEVLAHPRQRRIAGYLLAGAGLARTTGPRSESTPEFTFGGGGWFNAHWGLEGRGLYLARERRWIGMGTLQFRF